MPKHAQFVFWTERIKRENRLLNGLTSFTNVFVSALEEKGATVTDIRPLPLFSTGVSDVMIMVLYESDKPINLSNSDIQSRLKEDLLDRIGE